MYKRILKNTSLSLIANLISMILGMIGVLIFPKYLGVEVYGYYQLYLFFDGFVVLTSLGISDGIYLEEGGSDYKSIDKTAIGSQFFILMISQLFVYIFAFITLMSLCDKTVETFVYFATLVTGIITQPRYFIQMILQATNRIKEYAYIIIIERTISILVTTLFLAMGYKSIWVPLSIDIIGRLISLGYGLCICKDIVFIKPILNRETLVLSKKYIKQGFMLIIASFASTIIIGMYRYGIQWNWDIITFSKISLTISLSNMLLRAVNAIAVVLFPALRHIDLERMKNIYFKIDTFICISIFSLLIFYYPASIILEWWLPSYHDSFVYAVYLLPICLYESKSALLITTYIKTLRMEKKLLFINFITFVFTLVSLFITIIILNNIIVCLICILLSAILRCVIGEVIIMNNLNLDLIRNIILELFVTICFIVLILSNKAIYCLIYAVICLFYDYYMIKNLKISSVSNI